METQNQRLYEYLLDKPITALHALTELGIFRLAARVRDLKNKGVPIEKEMVEVTNRYGEKTRVARYYLS